LHFQRAAFFAPVLEELAMGVSASISEVLASGLSGKLIILVAILFLAVKLSNSSSANMVIVFRDGGRSPVYQLNLNNDSTLPLPNTNALC